MEKNMKQDIEKLLKSLPRNAASHDFTASVISRLEPPVKRERPIRSFAAAGIAALLISAAAGGQYLQERREEARLESLRAEQQRLASELEELKKITDVYEPVLYVGGTEEADIYVDLREPADLNRGNRDVRQTSGQITTDF
jgi:hypothetical protein